MFEVADMSKALEQSQMGAMNGFLVIHCQAWYTTARNTFWCSPADVDVAINQVMRSQKSLRSLHQNLYLVSC